MSCRSLLSRRSVAALAALALGAWALADVDYAAYSEKLDAASSSGEKARILKALAKELPADSQIRDTVTEASAGPASREQIDHAAGLVRAQALISSGPGSPSPNDPGAAAREIVSSPSYADPGAQESSNWLKRAIDRLMNKLKRSPNERRLPTLQAPGPGIDLLVTLMWVVLGLGLALFLFFAFRSFAWRRSLKRKASALLQDDEPERTADEWLEAADRLASEGKLREAVRCLYLACLLRLDEHGVARFERGQTNWEHLARIESSPKKPVDLSFQSPTRDFDRVWYGMRLRGPEDVDAFRAHYLALIRSLEAGRA